MLFRSRVGARIAGQEQKQSDQEEVGDRSRAGTDYGSVDGGVSGERVLEGGDGEIARGEVEEIGAEVGVVGGGCGDLVGNVEEDFMEVEGWERQSTNQSRNLKRKSEERICRSVTTTKTPAFCAGIFVVECRDVPRTGQAFLMVPDLASQTTVEWRK